MSGCGPWTWQEVSITTRSPLKVRSAASMGLGCEYLRATVLSRSRPQVPERGATRGKDMHLRSLNRLLPDCAVESYCATACHFLWS